MNNSTNHAVGYIRVSTRSQIKDKTYLNQIKIIEDYCNKNDLLLLTQYQDLAFSGKNKQRPELERMLHDIKELNINFIIVRSMDRLGRSLIDLHLIVNDLLKMDLGVIFIKEKLSFHTKMSPIERFQFQVIGAVAEMEAELIRERREEGIQRARDKGIKFGRKRKELLISDNELIRRRELGVSWKKLAKQSGVSPRTIKRRYNEIDRILNK